MANRVRGFKKWGLLCKGLETNVVAIYLSVFNWGDNICVYVIVPFLSTFFSKFCLFFVFVKNSFCRFYSFYFNFLSENKNIDKIIFQYLLILFKSKHRYP